jgi:rhomboid protease GluP
MNPIYRQQQTVENLSDEQLLALSYESIKALGWSIGTVSKKKIIAYNPDTLFSNINQLCIYVSGHTIIAESKYTGYVLFDLAKKNKKNTERFFAKLTYFKENIDSEQLAKIYENLLPSFVTDWYEDENHLNKSEENNFNGFLSLFIPRKSFFVTPILIDLNIILFLLMLLNGAGFIVPDNQVLINWGANFRPLTLDEGQWWRLFTSTFIHAGIFHLVMNMYALSYIGLLLEPYLGRIRFAILYVLTGLIASSASLCWHDFTVSIGASGAIFGMYGIFLAMLTTNIIEKTVRKALQVSIITFVAYNLIFGMKGNIDNAAHIGGLLSGMIFGYISYYSLIEEDKIDHDIKMIKSLALSALLTFTSIFIVSMTLDKKYSRYNNCMTNFAKIEENALSIYRTNTNDTAFIEELVEKGLVDWDKCNLILDTIEKADLPSHIVEQNNQLKKYISLRKETYSLIKESLKKGGLENDSVDKKLIEEKSKEIEDIINKMKGQ